MSGQTEKQIAQLPEDSIFIWKNDYLDIPKFLVSKLNRFDVIVFSRKWLNFPTALKSIKNRYFGVDHELLECSGDHAMNTYERTVYWGIIRNNNSSFLKENPGFQIADKDYPFCK